MKIVLSVFLSLVSIVSWSQNSYSLADFFVYNPVVEAKISALMDSMTDSEKAGQLLVVAAGAYGKPDEVVERLVREKKVGGVLLLNGDKEGFRKMVIRLDSINRSVNGVPLTYSADAEPSLIRYKIKNSTPVKTAVKHQSREEVAETAEIICSDLNYIGINFNYAPVIDISTDNEAIGDRSFGDNPDSVIEWSKEFVRVSQENNIVATAKHFPGHGQVKGDTHKKLVYIDGEMNEVPNYLPLIKAGVLSVMVAHIAVRNNGEYDSDLPATLNKKIVTDLLQDELGFKGIVITDAMGMGGVKSIPDNGVKALKAGVDILLMPENEDADIVSVVSEMGDDPEFRKDVEQSVRKVLRLKICLGLIAVN